MDTKLLKLEEQFKLESLKNTNRISNLFNGISIFVNGYTNPSADELKRMMLAHGGIFHFYIRSSTKFLIASNLASAKIKNITSEKILTPDWVVDCIKENKILDYKKYLLYTNQKASQPKLLFEKKESSMTALDPNFITDFYNNSRLHHIATLGASFKQYITQLRDKQDGTFPARTELKILLGKEDLQNKSPKTVMHIDMDCFFVSVGLRNRPNLIGLPVAVTHSKGSEAGAIQHRAGVNLKAEVEIHRKRLQEKYNQEEVTSFFETIEENNSMSEIASCSYEARKMGCKNGMFVGQALKLCPDLKTIPYDFDGYKEVAYSLYNTIAKYTLEIEAVSCDEMFVDLTDFLTETGIPILDFITFVRNEIKEKTGCTCSAGIGSNRLQARLATKKAKPNGQFYLEPKDVEKYIKNILISDLPGVGNQTSYKLENLNWKFCGDLQTIDLSVLQKEFGKKFGETLHQFCRGIDLRPLVFGHVRKSVSAEVNYGIRFTENSEVETFLRQLCKEVHSRLSEIKKKGKCITLKFMVRAKDAPVETTKFMGHGIVDNLTKSVTLPDFTCDLEIIIKTILSICKGLSVPPKELRGIGIQITKLNLGGTKNNSLVNMFNNAVVKKPQNTIFQPPNVISKKKTVKNSKLTNMFKNLKEKQDMLYEGLDSDVLAALPDDIREEVLKDHQLQLMKSKLSAEDEFLNALPSDLREEVQMDLNLQKVNIPIQKPSIVSSENIFLQNNWRFLLKSWIESESSPEEYDVKLLAIHGQELISSKQLNVLYVGLRYLHRIINELGSCEWHFAYFSVLKSIQETMLEIYNSSLKVEENFNCDCKVNFVK